MATGTAVDVVMPQMGVSVSEGTVTQWLKAVGDSVGADEPLLEISTDKVDTEVPSPASGVLAEILVQEGETVEVGTVIGTLQAGDGAVVAATPEPPAAAPESPAAEAVAPAAAAPAVEPAPTPAPAEAGADGERTFVSPVVSRIASEHGVDVAAVAGTGRGGRVTKKDILAFIDSGAQSPAPAAEAPAPAAAPPAPAAAPKPAPSPKPAAAEAADVELAPGEEAQRLSVMRRAISEHMRHSLETSAPVTTVFEIDMSNVVAIRERLKHEYAEQHGVKLTYLAFIVRAAVDTLQKYPWMNGEIRGDKIITRSFINIGIAVALDDGKGLIVPVIRNAEEKNLLGISRRSRISPTGHAASSSHPTMSTAARSRSRTRAATAPSWARRSSTSPNRRSSTSRRSSSGRGLSPTSTATTRSRSSR